MCFESNAFSKLLIGLRRSIRFERFVSRAVDKVDLFPNLESITIVRNIFFLCYYISSENRLVYANGLRELHGIRFKIIARLEKKKKNVSLKEI